MQTISVPVKYSDSDLNIITLWLRQYSIAVRTAYRHAASKNGNGEWVPTPETELRKFVKSRFETENKTRFEEHPIDAWLLHCATRDAIALRKARPDGKIVFGSKTELIRREKRLITEDDWRSARLRPMASLGDKSFGGNRHFKLSADGRRCGVTILKRSIALDLPQLSGKWGDMLPAVAKLAAQKEMNVTFRLGLKTLDITFDEMDLRKLPAGLTLQAAKDQELAAAGKKARGRTRGPNYIPPRLRADAIERFVHPEWKDRLNGVKARMLGIDLNPGWIGLSLVENKSDTGDLSLTKVLDHKLIKLDLPTDATDELVRETLAKVCGEIISLSRTWNCNQVTLESGLGKLRSRGKNRSLNRLLNFWARTVFEQMLRRRCRLAGIDVHELWCAYSTTIGNTVFNLPDACASAAEIGRRGLASLTDRKVILPKYSADLALRRWKDEGLSFDQRKLIENAVNWVEYHQALKTAKLGVRRPHGVERPLPGSVEKPIWKIDGHAVGRLGNRHRPGLIARPVLIRQSTATVGIGVGWSA